MLGSVWSVEAGVRRPEEEADLEALHAGNTRLEVERDSTEIDGPKDAFALIIERVLEEDALSVEYELGSLSDFLTEWMRREDPPGPDIYAGRIIEELLDQGEHEAAFRMLDVWFEYDSRGESEKSLVDIAADLDDFELSMDNVVSLGALKLLDNPEDVRRAAGEAVAAGKQLERSVSGDSQAALEDASQGDEGDGSGPEPNEAPELTEN
jgi:hypothetical protein